LSEYLTFERDLEAEAGRKTQVVAVISKRHGYTLGFIRWYGPWRQYVFHPESETLFNTGCLVDIQRVIDDLMAARRAKVPA